MRCALCGREVFETRHTREEYILDFLLINTGRVKRMDPKGAADNDEKPILVLTDVKQIPVCMDCLSKEHARTLWDSGFPDTNKFDLGK